MNSRIPFNGRRWFPAAFFVVLLMTVLALLPVLPSLLSDRQFYGLRVDLAAAPLAGADGTAAVPPEEGLAVVLFGYQNCGTVCPVQLTNLLALQQRMAGKPVRFVFVTLDPERDSRQRLDQVMSTMGPMFTAVRPESGAAARQLSAQYNDYAHRSGQGDNYELDHSAHLHVVSGRGRLELLYTSPDLDLDRVTEDLNRLLSDQRNTLSVIDQAPVKEVARQ